ncbi:CDP-diacylglycerol--serine O-phosphatidyltransferase [Phosphitispora sp. TUW77]|uniref:CDP-diacylglycerol--serine O-phosphatidyltransferase n=1 Tax=Phosphitispora sp. TUW77 TaxID=3152361 RepID=UPI003AB78EBC
MNFKFIPSLFTLSNLLLGITSLIFTMENEYIISASMILLAMILDAMDGRVARRLNATSTFGKELDSLADLVSFGVAPAILVYALKLKPFGIVGLIVCVAFALCGAIRLARFNVLNISGHFIGVPITAAGSLVALIVLVGHRVFIPPMVFPVLMIILSYLMVSKIKVPKY